MRAIFSKPNVRRAPGQSGQLNRIRHSLFGTDGWMYVSAKGTLSPWPASMVIQVGLTSSQIFEYSRLTDCGRSSMTLIK